MLVLALSLLLHLSPDGTPRTFVLTPQGGAMVLAAQDTPPSLVDARKLADQLRYEEAVVEYQRYLGVPDRPAKERAAALFELGFLHLVLGDEVSARQRALQALDALPALQAAPGAPARQVDFLAQVRREFLTRARITFEPRQGGDAPQVVRAKLVDPDGKVKTLLLRHAQERSGPWFSSQLVCDGADCVGSIPPPADAAEYTAWYFVEGLDAKRLTVAQAASADEPLQLSVVGRKAWYQSPVVWGVGGAALVGIAAVVFFLAPQPPR